MLLQPKQHNIMKQEFKKFILEEIRFYMMFSSNSKIIKSLEHELKLPLKKFYNYLKNKPIDNDMIQEIIDLWIKVLRIKIICQINKDQINFIKFSLED
jgi:hypothetical protein